MAICYSVDSLSCRRGTRLGSFAILCSFCSWETDRKSPSLFPLPRTQEARPLGSSQRCWAYGKSDQRCFFGLSPATRRSPASPTPRPGFRAGPQLPESGQGKSWTNNFIHGTSPLKPQTILLLESLGNHAKAWKWARVYIVGTSHGRNQGSNEVKISYKVRQIWFKDEISRGIENGL